MGTTLAPVSKDSGELVALYGEFDIGMDGQPRPGWLGRTLVPLRLQPRLQHYLFPDVYLTRILVNRRMVAPLAKVLEEFEKRWTYPERIENGLIQFVKCYCFGDGPVPQPSWWGASYHLSPKVDKVTLEQAIPFFTKAGFTWGGTLARKDERRFDYY
jgi:hypothetical protein